MTPPHEPSTESSPPSGPPAEPTPEDPREQEPMHDPPIYPERDGDSAKMRQAGTEGAIEAREPSPDAVVYQARPEAPSC
jgi:hypothetical protein